MNKSDSTNTLEEVYLSHSSLLSESTHFSDDALNDKIIPIQDSTATKRKNRFVTAFRSFRKKRSETKSFDEQTTFETEDCNESQQKTVKSEKKRSRASRLVKRLSMSGIKRTKKSTDNLKRETPEGATLSVSEISLLEIEVDENISVTKPLSKQPRKGDQLQITISGKKIERRKDSTVKANPISDTKVFESEPTKPQRKSKKFDITVSDQDIPPNIQAPSVPYSICGSDIAVSSISTVEKISHSFEQSSVSSTGVIKKSSFRKQRTRPPTMSVSKTGSLERGRRFPRPTDDTKTDSATAENVKESGATAEPTTGNETQSKPSECNTDEKPKIQFEVGTKVRPLSTSNLSRIDETTGRDELSSLDTSKCSESSSESKSDTSRRRIAYVAAPSISYSEDEPADSFLSREPLSHLSGISEYNSLDSDFSLPPLFGDVIDDDGVGGIFIAFFRYFFARFLLFCL